MKRIFDATVAIAALTLLCRLLVLVAVLVLVKLGSPVKFRQQRPGLDSQPFEMIKFRTMLDAHDSEGRPLPDSARMTPFGRLLRSSSFGGLPEIFNILRGDMSFVGPRPLLIEYLPIYSQEQARRHNVRPGLTGWAQINGRNALGWDDKFAFDTWYVDNRSFWLDLRILWLTARKVVVREGIAADGEVTVPAFTGSKVRTENSIK